jgi:hypothetical protein
MSPEDLSDGPPGLARHNRITRISPQPKSPQLIENQIL